MNERIQELAYQAEEYADTMVDGGSEFHPVFVRKFAELIVYECMEQVHYTREDMINGNISQVIKDRIEKHFGVE